MTAVDTKLPDLSQFTGSQEFYRHALMKSMTYTEGVKYVADTAGAHWFLDKIATLQMVPMIKGEEFQVWKLVVKNDKGYIAVENGNDVERYREEVTYTDFPEPGITLWCTNSMILLPSEY